MPANKEKSERYAPLISVLLICRENVEQAAITINSILEQEYPYREIFLLSKQAGQGKLPKEINFIRVTDSYTGTINKCLEQCQGDFIVSINTPDYFLPGAFYRVVNASRRHPERKILYGDILIKNQEQITNIFTSAMGFEELLCYWHNHIMLQPVVFIKAELFNKYGKFETNADLATSYAFLLKISLKEKLHHLCANLAVFNRSPHELDKTEFQQVYLQYRQFSQKIPSQKLLSFILVFSKAELKQQSNSLHIINLFLDSLRKQLVPDARLLMITNIVDFEKKLRLEQFPIEHQIIILKKIEPTTLNQILTIERKLSLQMLQLVIKNNQISTLLL